ncbi:zinc finger protein 407 [Talpa occidentalis]|uniref:zinc finger protein 407 n=1 Tax=Talpa occidentalis TaxID=50954 RepID=UPI00188EE868|nr:zinc finger protein 407 [Talpa occidentalis]
METEKKPGRDEDENAAEEAVAVATVSPRDADGGPPSAAAAENCTSKRGFLESSGSDGAVVEEDGSARAAKRMKLAEGESPQSGEQGALGTEAPESSDGGGAAQVAIRGNSLDGAPRPPQAFSLSGSFHTTEAVSVKTDPEEKPARARASPDPERASPSSLQQMSVACAPGDADMGLRCHLCGQLFPSSSDLQKHGDCRSQPAEGHACHHCGPVAGSSAMLHAQAMRGPGPQQAFSCDLCGFQCSEESLLDAHCLGKTHLRRQNLAARGGFVQILTKQPFPKKPCAMGTKGGPAKPRAKPAAKTSVSKGLQNAGGICGDFRGSTSKQSGSNSELLVEMTPSTDPVSERVEVAEENVAPCGVAGNPESQRMELGPVVTSDSLLDQSTKHTPPSAHETGAASKPRPERNILLLSNSFRRRAGTFALKGQAKKRFNLLGINKRGTSETQRMFMKHFRTQRASDAQSVPRHAGVSGSVHGACGASPATQDPQQGGGDSHRPCSLDSLTARPASDHQTPWTGTDCGLPAAGRTELEVHVRQGHARERAFSCQTCGLSSTSKGELEEHSHDNQHQQTASVLTCQCCPFTFLSELSLREHMREKHSAGFLCTLCDLLLLSPEAVEEHKAAERHRHLLGQSKSSQPLDSDLVFQTLPLGTLKLGNTKYPTSESGQAAQEEPVPSRVSHGGEVRHSSKPQFQCKKCFYKTRSSTVLTRHIKLRHGQDYHFLCKACNLYSLSKEGMEKHIKRSKHLENAKKNNIGLSFEECIERVCIGAHDKKEELPVAGSGRLEGHVDGVQLQEQPYVEKNRLAPKELSQPGVGARGEGSALSGTPKRGRPKGNNTSRTCSHCGLLASSTTNLTVHIRRKHSHQYSYLCKVCKYYTVTKGDMERHCATKKHRGRVEVEAHGKQSADIVVGPEGGNLEAGGKNSSAAVTVSAEPAEPEPAASGRPVFDPGHPEEVEVETGQDPAGKGQAGPEAPDLTPPGGACAPRDAAGPGDHRCAHCEFRAHSAASLELHVKRRHTREFAFYCLACEYYAVTPREMGRHAATEKHRARRQAFLRAPEEQRRQGCEALPVAAAPAPAPPRARSPERPAGPDAPRSADGEAQGAAHLGAGHPLGEAFQQPLAREKGLHPAETVPLGAPSNHGCPSKPHEENSGTLAPNFETAAPPATASDPGELRLRGDGAGGSPAGRGGAVPSLLACPGAPDPAPPPEGAGQVPAAARRARGQEDPEGGGGAQAPGALEGAREDSALEDEAVLLNSQQEAKMVLEEDGPAPAGTAESGDVYETVVSVDDKGQAVYSLRRFDSSIIRIKSPEDGELMGHSEAGLVAGVRTGELPVKDAAQGARKKKSEGASLGESSRIRCDDCGFLADGLSGLNVHIAMKHPTKEKHFHCLLCGKSFYTESNLHQHLASAGHMRNEQASVEELPEGGATFKCVKCTEPFDSEQNLFLHIKGQHEELLREVNKYIVEDTEQINREREENQGNVCKYCGKMCRSSNSMAFLAHIRTHTGSKPFKCKICHFATAQLGDARNHVKRHLGMREYKCHVCGVAFVMKKHLNTHLLGKHGVGTPKERKFTCHLCDRSFTEKWALNNHMKLHTGEKPFKCSWPTCHYSFLTASAMKDHYRTHTGEKSFLCDLCGFAGGTRHALTKHRRQHTGEKPFKCDECNFASTTQSHLTRHKRVHTGEKPYRCPWCDYRSNCAENIRKHILHTGKHEGVRMYNCPKCAYGTNVPVEFRNHLKEQHPDIENPDLAYLHAGIVSKSYECRLKGQGATFVETDSPFTAAGLVDESPVKDRPVRSGRRQAPTEQVQQVIIIQGYDGEFALDASVEETAAATLQTLALAGQVARVVHITEDGQVIATGQAGTQTGGGAPGAVLPEQLEDAAAQVVVVGASLDGAGAEEPLSPGRAAIQQVTKQDLVELAQAGVPAPDAASALDALLCAVTELGGVDGRVGPEEKGRPGPRDVLVQLPAQEAPLATQPEGAQIHMFHDLQDGPAAAEPVEVLTQVVRPTALITSQERAQVAFKKVVQGVLQFAVCDPAGGQLVKEGVTQVIVNEEGAVHMLAQEGAQIIMQEAEAPGPHVDLAEPDGEISQIIVTEELVQAMVQESRGPFPEGATHYIVTELPPGVRDSPGVFSHTVIEAADSQEVLQAGAALSAEAVVPAGSEQLTSMVIYTQEGSSAAAVLQSQRESSELQEA